LLPGDEVPPDVPEPGPGSIFVPTAAGFELDPRLPEETERNDAVQKALHISITRRIERLRDAIARISNTHPILAAEFADYAVFVGPDLAELDVASLWSAGSGLSEFVRAFDTQDPSSTITPPLEPETLAEFRALLRDHTAFILGFDTGRKLTERAAALHAVERRPEEIKDAVLAVLRPMLNTPRLLAGRAQHLVQSLTRALEDWPAKTFSLLVGSVETGRNSLRFFADGAAKKWPSRGSLKGTAAFL
jgi:pimeloyl-ACP methyl ester carboxylesterase